MEKEKVTNLVQSAVELDEHSRREFLEGFFNAFGERERFRLFQWVCYCLYPRTKWIKVERWMEGQFRRDMNKTPSRVASTAVNYFRINSKMMPFLIKMAQRIKMRIRTRRRRHPEEFVDLKFKGQEEA